MPSSQILSNLVSNLGFEAMTDLHGRLTTLRDEIDGTFPTNWCDALLSGPSAVIGNPPYGPPDIERLVGEIRKQVADKFSVILASRLYLLSLSATEREDQT